MFVWIDQGVAVSSMPRGEDIEDLAGVFDVVLVLVEDKELGYDLNLWEKYGVDFRRLPIPDFGVPSLEELYDAVKWLVDRVKCGQKVLIHCLGGRGRSGTVAAAYLVFKGFNADEAISYVRKCVIGAIETRRQEDVIRKFEGYLKSCGHIG